MRKLLVLVGFLTLAVCPPAGGQGLPEFWFANPEVAGTFRLGLAAGEKSWWFDQMNPVRTEKDGIVRYTAELPDDPQGKIEITIRSLLDNYGLVIGVECYSGGYEMHWAYGGCSAEAERGGEGAAIPPADCKDNVFSQEGNQFAVYYGTSRRLRLIHGITPLGTLTRLCDAYRQDTPLDLWHSGKKTDAPVLGGVSPLTPGVTSFFCFYRQSPKADYNVYMLPELMATGRREVHTDQEWMESTPN